MANLILEAGLGATFQGGYDLPEGAGAGGGLTPPLNEKKGTCSMAKGGTTFPWAFLLCIT